MKSAPTKAVYILFVIIALISSSNTLANVSSEKWMNNLEGLDAVGFYDFSTEDNNQDSLLIFKYSSEYDSVPYKKSISFFNNDGKLILRNWYIWDSLSNVWIHSEKVELNYNELGYNTDENQSSWNSDLDEWTNRSRHTYTYDEDGNMTNHSMYYWNTSQNDWVGMMSWEVYYDEEGVISDETYVWDETLNDWIGHSSTVEEITVNGNETTRISFAWSSVENDWIYDTKKVAIADEQSQIISTTVLKWNSFNQTWSNLFQYSEEYNDNNDLIIYEKQKWVSSTNSWMNSERTEYTYTSNSNLVVKIIYSWDKNNDKWQPVSKNETDSDDSGNTTLIVDYRWDALTETWIGIVKNTYVFNDQGKLLTEIHYRWNGTEEEWIAQDKYEAIYTLSDNGVFLRQAYYDWNHLQNTWEGTLLETKTMDTDDRMVLYENYSWDSNVNQWVINSKWFYFYYISVTSNASLTPESQKIFIYPNPSSGLVTIEIEDKEMGRILIFNSDGKIMLQKNIASSPTTIDISAIPNGIYFYVFSSNKQKMTGKILLLKE